MTAITWEEAWKAFKEQTPVEYMARGSQKPITCTRIAELGMRCDIDGQFRRFIGAMDKNERCIYHGTLDMFRIPETD